MKRSLMWCFRIMVFFFWIGNIHAADSSATASKVPSLDVPEKTFDFGEVMEGSEVSHDFVIKNNGAEVLQIRQVRPG